MSSKSRQKSCGSEQLRSLNVCGICPIVWVLLMGSMCASRWVEQMLQQQITDDSCFKCFLLFLWQAPPRSGPRFFNYKDFFSIILLAVCNANQSAFKKMIRSKQMKLPPKCHIEGMEKDFSFFFAGDAAFQRSQHMMASLKGKFLAPEKKIYNYRLSRARKSIESSFGMLCQRYEVFTGPLKVSIPLAKSIVLSCTALHNLNLMDKEGAIPSRWKSRPGPYEDHLEKSEYGRFRNENTKME